VHKVWTDLRKRSFQEKIIKLPPLDCCISAIVGSDCIEYPYVNSYLTAGLDTGFGIVLSERHYIGKCFY